MEGNAVSVENGLSSFSDSKTFGNYNQEIKDFYNQNKDGDYYKDVLEKHFKENSSIPPASSKGEDWINYKLTNTGGNIIMFASGWGDGLYTCYVGYDKNGNIVKLVADFIQIKGNEKGCHLTSSNRKHLFAIFVLSVLPTYASQTIATI